MPMDSFSVIKRKNHRDVQRILGLPDDKWCDVTVQFGLDEVGIATVKFILTAEQTVALAQLAMQYQSDICLDRSSESVQRDLIGDD